MVGLPSRSALAYALRREIRDTLDGEVALATQDMLYARIADTLAASGIDVDRVPTDLSTAEPSEHITCRCERCIRNAILG
jgi:hypothetical protein